MFAVTEDTWDTFDKVAAANACWDMGNMTLESVAEHMGMKPPANADLHGVLHLLVKWMLRLSDKPTSVI